MNLLKIKLNPNQLLSKRFRRKMLMKNPIVREEILKAFKSGQTSGFAEALTGAKNKIAEEYLREIER